MTKGPHPAGGSGALSGRLRTWNDDRGFGFIAPTQGGRELFVHISAFPRDGSRPTEGETLIYELGPGRDGQPQAVRVTRSAVVASGESRSPASTRHRAPERPVGPRVAVAADGGSPASRARRAPARTSFVPMLIGVALLVAAGGYGVRVYQRQQAAQQPVVSPSVTSPLAPGRTSRFRCDGRQHCSQMTSCEEATFFLRNCPDTKMDGDGDGIPCESQWCPGGR